MATQLNRIHAFIGPTITEHEAQALRPDIVFHPPIQCGDLFHILPEKPAGIIIIDGFFELTASIWHKEILHTLSLNIPVLGASSMGALRAAELHRFGMQGIGDIFHAYCSSELTDDDEVAVSHYPRELNFQPNSDAMINIRRTLQLAQQHDMISQAQHDTLINTAKHTFYPQRCLQDLIQQSVLPTTQQTSLRQWLKNHEINQKKQDAIKALTTTKLSIPSDRIHHTSTIQSYNLFKLAQQSRCRLISHDLFFQQFTTLLLANYLLTPPNTRCHNPIRQAYHDITTQIINHTLVNPSTIATLHTHLNEHQTDYQAFASITQQLYLYPKPVSGGDSDYGALRQQLWAAIKAEFQLDTKTTNPTYQQTYVAQFYRHKQISCEQTLATLTNTLQLSAEDLNTHLGDQSLYKHHVIDSRLSPCHWDAEATMHDWACIAQRIALGIKHSDMASYTSPP